MEQPAVESMKEKYSVGVAYNGEVESISVSPQAAVEAVFRHALKAFDLEGSAGNLALHYNGQPLSPQQSLAAQGVPNGATLHLQPRVVRNGEQ